MTKKDLISSMAEGTLAKQESKQARYVVRPVDHSLADDFLQRHHYLAQQGNGFLAKYVYGLFTKDNRFVGVVTFSGISVVETLIGAFEGFTRESDQSGFFELSRLAMDDDNKEKNLTSWFVARAIKQLRKDTNVRALISYADSKYHNGYIYQATNFKYYGKTAKKTDFFALSNGDYKQVWRGAVKNLEGEWRERTRKHRYMIVFDKELKILWKEEPYPKGTNDEYKLQEPSTWQSNIFDFIAAK